MLTAALLTIALSPQSDPSTDDLEAVLAAERTRIEAMDRVQPAVCSVMHRGSPGGGSGVIFDPLGFVLTNFHVVGKPTVSEMLVGLPDGNLYEATVLGIDPGSDLAVLLLDDEARRPWPHAPLGDSDDLLVGETVFAMGNPFLLATDFTPTVTWGIVSGTHRYQPGPGNRALVYPDCIQVDSPVNPGNSGGPLFNARGEVVGINGRISVRDRGRVNVGVGFAIASNQIRNFLGDLMAGRHAEHGTLDLNAWFMRAPHDPERSGVFVQALFEDSLVGDFGLALGDEITHFCDVPVRSANQLATLVGVLPSGTWVSLTFRPVDEEAVGEPQRIEFPLPTLDTGSSHDPERIASQDVLELAASSVVGRIPATFDAPGATLELRGPNGRVVTLRRLGERLRIDDGATALVRTGDGEGFRIDDGVVVDLEPEHHEKLARVLRTNPWLRRGAGLREILASGRLTGGVMVGARPAYRIELPGDGRRQVWLFEDGNPAGCRYRDPVRRGVVELHRGPTTSRIVIDGELFPGWVIEAPSFDSPPPDLFERPVR
ncbi:MAG: trypsin-like peptidase domain-containing protein [Planctomycetes bacterium]|nr:trypsin-like peptidase domain-containing protein [Planctomycetota bacterium]